jgi:hypothetical protein
MAAHDYAEACPKFEESYKLQEAIGTRLNLAACYEAEGRLAIAWSTFLEVASKARAAGQKERAAFALDRAASLAPKLSNVTIDVPSEARAPGLEIRRDGNPVGPAEWGTPLPADAGDHTVQASAPGHKPWSKTITVAARATIVRVAVPKLDAVQEPMATTPPPAATHATAQRALSPPLPPRDEISPHGNGIGRPLGLVAGGVSVAGIAAGTVFGLLAVAAVDRRNQECPSAPCLHYDAAVHDHDQAVQDGLISDLGFIAGGALLAGGAALFFLSGPGAPSSTESTRGVAVLPSAGSSSAGISLQGTF